jgi:hypothetical protein
MGARTRRRLGRSARLVVMTLKAHVGTDPTSANLCTRSGSSLSGFMQGRVGWRRGSGVGEQSGGFVAVGWRFRRGRSRGVLQAPDGVEIVKKPDACTSLGAANRTTRSAPIESNQCDEVVIECPCRVSMIDQVAIRRVQQTVKVCPSMSPCTTCPSAWGEVAWTMPLSRHGAGPGRTAGSIADRRRAMRLVASGCVDRVRQPA